MTGAPAGALLGCENMVEMSPKLQNQIAQYQQIQQQLQMVMAQKGQYSMQLEEVERSLEELGKAGPDTPTYRNVGALLIRVEKLDELKKELEESRDTLGIKIKSMERQENQLKERFTSLRTELQSALQGAG
jgi:prefoldin beta subunit